MQTFSIRDFSNFQKSLIGKVIGVSSTDKEVI